VLNKFSDLVTVTLQRVERVLDGQVDRLLNVFTDVVDLVHTATWLSIAHHNSFNQPINQSAKCLLHKVPVSKNARPKIHALRCDLKQSTDVTCLLVKTEDRCTQSVR